MFLTLWNGVMAALELVPAGMPFESLTLVLGGDKD